MIERRDELDRIEAYFHSGGRESTETAEQTETMVVEDPISEEQVSVKITMG